MVSLGVLLFSERKQRRSGARGEEKYRGIATGRREGRRNCCQNVIHERGIKKKDKIKNCNQIDEIDVGSSI